VQPVWRIGDMESLRTLAHAVAAEDPHVLLIQHQPGLLSWESLTKLLSAPEITNRIVVVTLHNTRHLMDIEESERAVVVDALSRVARILVHTIADLNLLKSLGLVTNVAMFPHGALPPRATPAPRPISRNAAPLIGCYGFFLPGKGIPQLIEAVSALRRRWPNVRLRLVNADYGAPQSATEIALCRQKAEELGIAAAIEWVTDFLPNDRSLDLLSECDVIAMPYQESKEAASGALRVALSAGVPVAATPLALFDEVGNAAVRFSGTAPAAIADSLDKILRDKDLRDRTVQAAREWLAERSWQRLAKRLHGMVLGLARHAAVDRATEKTGSDFPPEPEKQPVGQDLYTVQPVA
jgi:glycosyltransferase involved in cell wall biosynthesis